MTQSFEKMPSAFNGNLPLLRERVKNFGESTEFYKHFAPNGAGAPEELNVYRTQNP